MVKKERKDYNWRIIISQYLLDEIDGQIGWLAWWMAHLGIRKRVVFASNSLKAIFLIFFRRKIAKWEIFSRTMELWNSGNVVLLRTVPSNQSKWCKKFQMTPKYTKIDAVENETICYICLHI